MTDPNQEEARQQAERDKAIREQMDARGYDPDNPAERAKFEELLAKVAANRITQQDLHRGMVTYHFEEADKQRREDAGPKSAAEREPQNEQRTDHKPEEDRDHSRPAEATADRGEEKKKVEEQEFDAKRFMSDPDYRRQMNEQRQAEQREHTESREQEAERTVATDRQL